MVEDGIQLVKIAVNRHGVLCAVGFLQFLKECLVVFHSGVSQQGFIGGQTFYPVSTNHRGVDTRRSQPQKIGIALHLLDVGLVHELLDVSGVFNVGGQILQQTLVCQRLVTALEVNDVRFGFAVHNCQRHGGCIVGGRGFHKLHIHIHSLLSHFFVDGSAQVDNIFFGGEQVLVHDLDRYGFFRCADLGGFTGLGIGALALSGLGLLIPTATGNQAEYHGKT